MTIRKTRRRLYGAARLLGDVDAATHPAKARRRVKNKVIGRLLRSAGFWRRLWR